jgi:uncharacterized membrane protein
VLYSVLKFLHVAGLILLIGNVTITAFWKVFADRSRDPKIVAHAQYIVILADYFFTLPGIALILIGGYGMAYVGGINVLSADWLGWSQILFFASGLIWLGILVPAQIRQARAARAMTSETEIPKSYNRDGRLWLIWGIIATVPLVAASYLMIAKP